MQKKEFKERINQLIQSEVEGFDSIEQTISFIESQLLNYKIELHNKSLSAQDNNKGKPWSDTEISLVLNHAPTKENVLKLAQTFSRGTGSIDQIFRWAAASAERVENTREGDKYIQQIRRLKKENQWRF